MFKHYTYYNVKNAQTRGCPGKCASAKQTVCAGGPKNKKRKKKRDRGRMIYIRNNYNRVDCDVRRTRVFERDSCGERRTRPRNARYAIYRRKTRKSFLIPVCSCFAIKKKKKTKTTFQRKKKKNRNSAKHITYLLITERNVFGNV